MCIYGVVDMKYPRLLYLLNDRKKELNYEGKNHGAGNFPAGNCSKHL